MKVEENVAVVSRFIGEVINQGRVELIPELWTSDLAWHGGSLDDVYGVRAYTEMLTASTNAFEDLHLTVHDTVAERSKVVVRFTNAGRSIGPFLGAGPTNEVIRWDGVGIYELADGRIAEAWFSEDVLAIARRLGLISL
jgi:predicted ester cyclase